MVTQLHSPQTRGKDNAIDNNEKRLRRVTAVRCCAIIYGVPDGDEFVLGDFTQLRNRRWVGTLIPVVPP